MVEEPGSTVALSTLSVIDRYVLELEIFDHLKNQKGAGGGGQLIDAISNQLDFGMTYAHRFEGIRFDCGSKQGI